MKKPVPLFSLFRNNTHPNRSDQCPFLASAEINGGHPSKTFKFRDGEMTFKILTSGLIMACVIATTGCGGKTDEGSTLLPPQEMLGPQISDNNRDLTVADISGQWKFNIEVYGPQDEAWAMNEYHVIITPTGEYYEYDYMGDSLAERQNEYGNCFKTLNEGLIEKLPDGGFQISMGSDNIIFYTYANYELNDGKLLDPATIYGGDVVSAVASSFTREDILQMACDQ